MSIKLKTKNSVSTFDKLARERTLLANERTWLAYIRTGLSFFLLGMGLVKFFNEIWIIYLGAASLMLGVMAIGISAIVYLKRNRDIKKM